MRTLSLIIVFGLVTLIPCVSHGQAHKADASTLSGKVIVGYQGWFACPGDGAKLAWGHWGTVEPDGKFKPAVDELPDVSELTPSERCATPMRTAEGADVSLYSSQNPKTVDRHLLWLEQNDIDGLAVQRFAAGLLVPDRVKGFDRMLDNVRQGAETHGRVFFVMYDLSGLKNEDIDTVVRDWKHLEDTGLTRSPAYLHHKGHPLIAIWGLGFSGRPLTADVALRLLDELSAASAGHGGATFLGGVPYHWRTGGSDASMDPKWRQVWPRLAVISPWAVGRYRDNASADEAKKTSLLPDQAAASSFGVDYMPVVFPGFSYENPVRERNFTPEKMQSNIISRRCGAFYWRQIFNALSADSTMLYVAMFDEVNEGTAIYKMVTKSSGLAVDGVETGYQVYTPNEKGCEISSDGYLRLTGAAAAALHNHTRPKPGLPFAPTP